MAGACFFCDFRRSNCEGDCILSEVFSTPELYPIFCTLESVYGIRSVEVMLGLAKEIGVLTCQPSYAVDWARKQANLLGSTPIKTNPFEASPTIRVRAEVAAQRFSLMIDLIEKLEEELAELKQIVRLKDSATTSVNGPDLNALNALVTLVNRTCSILKQIQKDISEHYGKHGKSLWQAGVYVYLHSMDHLTDLIEKVGGLVSGSARRNDYEGYQGELGVLFSQLQQVKNGFKSFMKLQAECFLHTRETIKNLEMTLASGPSSAVAANDSLVQGTTDVQRLAAGASGSAGAGEGSGSGSAGAGEGSGSGSAGAGEGSGSGSAGAGEGSGSGSGSAGAGEGSGSGSAGAGSGSGSGSAGAGVVYTDYVL